jgi:hypothetical protein
MTVKNVQLWILHGADRKGLLADALEPLAVMGYRYPAELDRAAVEVFPIDPPLEAAARKAGFQPSETPCLLVEGDDRKGLGAEISRALANAGINMGFLVAETMGKKFSAAIGLATGQDATAAAKAIESLGPPAKARKK